MGRFTCDQKGMKACELVGSYRQKSGVWDRQTWGWPDQSIDINIILVIWGCHQEIQEDWNIADVAIFSRQTCGFTCTYKTIGFNIEQNPKLGVDNWYPPVSLQKAIEHGPVEIVDLPIKNGGSFHSKMWQFTRPPGRKRLRCHRNHVWRRGSALSRCG